MRASPLDPATMVIGPCGRPESYFWAVQYHSGDLVQERGPDGRDCGFSIDVRATEVRWIVLQPQHAHLTIQRVRVPFGARAYFTRRREIEGVIGVNGSEVQLPTWTGIGWRWPDGTGPTLFFGDDGSSVSGDDFESVQLTEALRQT